MKKSKSSLADRWSADGNTAAVLSKPPVVYLSTPMYIGKAKTSSGQTVEYVYAVGVNDKQEVLVATVAKNDTPVSVELDKTYPTLEGYLTENNLTLSDLTTVER